MGGPGGKKRAGSRESHAGRADDHSPPGVYAGLHVLPGGHVLPLAHGSAAVRIPGGIPGAFHKAASLSTPQIEQVDIPFANIVYTAYFVAGGNSKQPTLLVINGGDSTNEEMFNWMGQAAADRGGIYWCSRGRGSGARCN